MSSPDPGYAFPWEREAMRGAELPDGLLLYDQMAYLSLRTVYRDYYEKRLDRAAASAEKRRIVAAWRRARDVAEFQRKLALFSARVFKDTEAAKTAVLKNPTPENAIRLCNVMDGIERGGEAGGVP